MEDIHDIQVPSSRVGFHGNELRRSRRERGGRILTSASRKNMPGLSCSVSAEVNGEMQNIYQLFGYLRISYSKQAFESYETVICQITKDEAR